MPWTTSPPLGGAGGLLLLLLLLPLPLILLSLSLSPPPLSTPPILPLCDLAPAPDGPVALPHHHPCLMCHGSLGTERIPYEFDRYNSKLNGEEERYSHLVRIVMYINSNIKLLNTQDCYYQLLSLRRFPRADACSTTMTVHSRHRSGCEVGGDRSS